MDTSDAQASAPVYVKFGPRPTEEIRIEWAEAMLTELKDTNPPLFGRLLTKAIGASR